MTFSVATSWLLPMNDRLHVRTGLDLSSAGSLEEAQAIAARLGAYLGTLPEYSMVEVMPRLPGEAMFRVVGAVVYGATDESAVGLPIENFLMLGESDVALDSDYFVDGVGYEITARDVQHAIVRTVPDMTEIRTQEDLDRFEAESRAIGAKTGEVVRDLLGTLPDGSLLDDIWPGGSPDIDSGALVDYRRRYIVYDGQQYALPLETEYVPPHLPGQEPPPENMI